MEERYYLDTSVWMDYYEDRKDPYRDIGEYAYQLLCRLMATNSKILVSFFLFKELSKYYSMDDIRGMATPFERSIVRVSISREQSREAKLISQERNMPKADVIHAILARDNDAVLVSRDKHFNLLKDICRIAKPEDVF
jgi:predicted nucleic acid-binding protein